MERIKTNIIELDKLSEIPVREWLKLSEDKKLDAHKVDIYKNQLYKWLYKNSQYDLIGWEIEHNCFDWENYSWAVAKYCPQHFVPEKYNWEKHSFKKINKIL